jgi:tRNA(adenine34) deaminase
MWNDLEAIWQTAFSEAWLALQNGSVPISAVITDENGIIKSIGRNHIFDKAASPPQICDSILAHAEMNALLRLSPKRYQCNNYELYTTCEPCPMCLSTFYMSGIRTIHFASRDPYAGSINLLGTTPYLQRKHIQVTHYENNDFEKILIAIHTAYIKKRDGSGQNLVLDQWNEVFEDYVNLGLNEQFSNYLWNNINTPNFKELYDHLCEISEGI